MKKVVPKLYGKGGPVIMLQVEDKFGSSINMNNGTIYKEWMRDEISKIFETAII